MTESQQGWSPHLPAGPSERSYAGGREQRSGAEHRHTGESGAQEEAAEPAGREGRQPGRAVPAGVPAPVQTESQRRPSTGTEPPNCSHTCPRGAPEARAVTVCNRK